MHERLGPAFFGELAGTFLLVFFGIGSVHVAVLTGGISGLGQVAAVWGLAVAMGIYATAHLSGAHLNPAISVALCVYRGFPWTRLPAYVIAQSAGAFAAAAVLYGLFCGTIARFEQTHQIARGQPGSQRSAMVYGEYFPNPELFGTDEGAFAQVSHLQAMAAEAVGTALLALVVFAATAPRAGEPPRVSRIALSIGLGLSAIIMIIAPITQAGLNPARDFGPRLFAWLAGWGSVALPGPRGGFFTVYLLAPVVGALAGAGLFQCCLRPDAPPAVPKTEIAEGISE